MVVVRTNYCALAADQFFACLTKIDKRTFMVDAVSKIRKIGTQVVQEQSKRFRRVFLTFLSWWVSWTI